MTHTLQLLIGGTWQPSLSEETFAVTDPATGEEVGRAARATPQDARRAVEAAYGAFRAWARVPPPDRGQVLKRAARLAHERAAELGRLLTLEQGKPLREAVGEVRAAADALEFFGEEGWRICGETMPTNRANRRSYTIKQPLGVVVAVSAWNYPVLLMAWKVGPALVAGNTVVAKPPSPTPLAVSRFIELLVEAGAPAGVVNIVTGSGSVLGPVLVQHPLTAKVALTGQTETGRQILTLAASGMKRVALELGGHTPLIVFADADLDKAVKDGVYRAFRNAGQICNAVNRIYVQNAILPQFVERFVEETAKLTLGHGLDDPDVGPMCTSSGVERVKGHIADAVAHGARVVIGGKTPSGERFARGYFFEPTVLVDVRHEMRVMREETFGPVVAITGFGTVDEAIAYANDSPYGLVAYVYTGDLRTAYRMSEELEYGTVGVNNVAGGEFAYPYGGWKQSGMGIENSRHAVDEYLQVKHVRIDL